jgi:hypothetical protein
MDTITTFSFPRPTKALLSMNDRHHWQRRRTDVKAWRTAAYFAARSWGRPPATVCVTLDVPTRAKRDPANYFATVKPIVDGFVDAGLWPDDTPEYVTVIEPVLRYVGTKAPLMVTVELKPR